MELPDQVKVFNSSGKERLGAPPRGPSQEEAPEKSGQTWVALVAEVLVRRAATGVCKLLQEWQIGLIGRPAQSVTLHVNAQKNLAERIAEGRRRVNQTLAAYQRHLN